MAQAYPVPVEEGRPAELDLFDARANKGIRPASGLAVALAFGAARLAAEPVMHLPPKASVVSQVDRPRPPGRRPRAHASSRL